MGSTLKQRKRLNCPTSSPHTAHSRVFADGLKIAQIFKTENYAAR